MVTYNENTELDITKFDIYNQYRDQICFIKVAKKQFNVNVDPDNWQELKNIIKLQDKQHQIQQLNNWFLNTAPESYGPTREFEFTEGLLERIIDLLRVKLTT